ncbi:MAG: HGxxPAAW family protein [Actinomycetota bacterium]|nr:HGxxPAAW family protein [Actinomycetota bacterium]
MTDAPNPIAHGHGNTKAAWTAVTIIMIASIVGALGVMMNNWIVFWVGVALVVVGAIVGKVMQMMGLGQVQHV